MLEGVANGLSSGGKAASNLERKFVANKKKPKTRCLVKCISRSMSKRRSRGLSAMVAGFLRKDGLQFWPGYGCNHGPDDVGVLERRLALNELVENSVANGGDPAEEVNEGNIRDTSRVKDA